MPLEFKKDLANVMHVPELKIAFEAVGDKIIILVDPYKSGYECKTCGGTGKIKSAIVKDAVKDCTECKGKGTLIVIPDNAKSLPTTGVIVSMGPKTEFMKGDSNTPIQVGARVVVGPHVGTPIPLRVAGIRLVIMRESEPLCIIYGSEEVSDKDIIDYNQNPDGFVG